MAKTKIKDDLALLITGLIIAVITWAVFQRLGMWVFYIYALLILYVCVRRYLRTRKNRN
ncbi:hypothetical protein [Marinobacter sp. ANT_B65]|uniref:hypothetical protein n=1 Tax=Marinobacter sp. ANT_B65 TaxID=2039467 RepID=UPI0015CE8D37|nr:hypothetical protein [Marinobacter sp. ANT_B65]